ncbi:ABC-2 type transport system ATP-binding protein [Clostridium cavendishii DSM 21758]|uniref:ABC-2 type transport system ATP-binding protein n=1 Tax=Clostridium cavendishii DSM 21758 TaxID=1121302 RepID=A0A1M6TXJ5_9CLOT|nr:ABC transporter ATP-binding protein [Clostridium cavendishii]SHK61613.1 ABC-2 type transport system ATP-binding protein [Clostridium cavendishii DSM 21758]
MIVEINDLVKRYDDFIAVDNVNIKVSEGEILGLLGPNGAGKTTIINVLMGLISFNSGTIKVLEKDIIKFEDFVKKNMGIVPQDLAIYEDLTTWENLWYFGKLYGLKGEELKKSIEEALKFIGLSDKAKEYPKKLSVGMKRRLNIGCALVHKPKLIIMDEPTVGIDPQSRNHILQSIKELNRRGTTIIYTTHYMDEVEEICSRIVIIDNGRVIAEGDAERLKSMVSTDEIMMLDVNKINFTLIDNLRNIQGVKMCEYDRNRIRITFDKRNKILSRVIEIINEKEIEILSISIEKPSLETVFLNLTGRSLRE